MNRSYREQPARPDADRMAEWLGSGDVASPSGQVASWHNPGHPGFPYPEAAAIWLSWAAWRRERGLGHPPPDQLDAVAGVLMNDIGHQGTVGRKGHRHLFDTCVAIHALVRAGRAFDSVQEPCSGELASTLTGFLHADSPVLPEPTGDPRWSRTWGIYQVRSAALLFLAGEIQGDNRARETALAIRRRAESSNHDTDPQYVHALAYGAEGELLFRAIDGREGAVSPHVVANELARLQGPDGHLPAWTDGTGGGRADATAQAIRIWVALDPDLFREATERALSYLAARQSGRGGIEYREGSGDLNTWATAFTDQALNWVYDGAQPLGWI